VQTSGSEVVDEELVGSIATGGFSAVAIENGGPEPTRPLLRFEASRAARNATEPAPVLWPDQSRDLFDVVIVVARAGPCGTIAPELCRAPDYRLSIVYCSAMRSVAGRGLNLAEYVTAINLTALLYRLCFANTLVGCGQSFDRVPARYGKATASCSIAVQ
jgi:hypothetical protein